VYRNRKQDAMHTGMLWFDNSAIDVQAKIQKALDYYVTKYGRKPDLCLLNPRTLGTETIEIEGLTVKPYKPVLPGHIWLGIEDKE
jgi:hypothetical protein